MMKLADFISVKKAQRPAHGFTLLEVLIALGIVAVIALMSWRGLDEVIDMAGRLNRVDAQLQEVSAIFGQLDKDLSRVENQLAKGLAHTPDGVQLDQSGLSIISTLRQQGKPTFQQSVQWQLTDGGLYRTTSTLGESNDRPQRSEALPVKGMRIRLWADGQGFNGIQTFGEVKTTELQVPNYEGTPNPLKAVAPPPAGQPQPGQEAQAAAAGITRAVEITLTLLDGRSVTRFLLLGGLR